MAKIIAKEYSGVTGNVGTLAWVRAGGERGVEHDVLLRCWVLGAEG